MKPKFHKTEHFLFRQWDRGIDDKLIEKITCRIEQNTSKKSMIIAGAKFLKKAGIKVKKTTSLIIYSKGKSLLTLFFVDDLYAYLKSQKGKINSIIL